MAKVEKGKKTGVQPLAKRNDREQMALIGVVVVVVVVFVGFLIFLVTQQSNSAASAQRGNYSQLVQQTTDDGAPILGDPIAKVTIVAWEDFSCPHCQEYHPIMTEIIDKLVRTGQARLVYRPETFVGKQYSVVASEAALCAQKQNGFWDMFDALFDMQSRQGVSGFEITNLRDTAKGLGMDGEKIVQCMLNHDTKTTLDSTERIGQSLKVNSTPTLMYSTDGQNYNFFKASDPATEQMVEITGGGVPFDAIAQTVAAAYSTKK